MRARARTYYVELAIAFIIVDSTAFELQSQLKYNDITYTGIYVTK